jgi:hypothetical protein
MFVGTIKSPEPYRSLGGRIRMHELGEFPEWQYRIRRVGSAAARFNLVGQSVRQRVRAHECENSSAHRIIFVVELDHGEMIRAFEHQLLNGFIARRPQSIREPARIQHKTGKILRSVKDQKRRRISSDVMDWRRLL